MKNSNKLINITKLIIIYIFCYATVCYLSKDVLKLSYLGPYLQKYRYIAIRFILIFPILLKLCRVEIKYISKFYIFIMITLLFSLLNLSLYTDYASTPDGHMFPILTTISMIINYPFTSVINTLVGYGLSKLSYIAVPLYVFLLWTISYLLNKITINKDK